MWTDDYKDELQLVSKELISCGNISILLLTLCLGNYMTLTSQI